MSFIDSDVILRAAVLPDARDAGHALYHAFKTLADAHGFTPDFPSPDVGGAILGTLIEHPGFYGVVAARNGRLIGSNFMDECSAVFGIGPISVDPSVQNTGVGRRLMQDTLDRAASRKAAGVRLLQAAYHNRSLCLYSSLGFKVREPLSVLQGPPPQASFAGYRVRPAERADLGACNALCRDVHGFDRSAEVNDAIEHGDARVVEHLGELSDYTTLIGFRGHSVARSDVDLLALIGAAAEFQGPGFIVPTRNHRVFAWCLAHGLKLVMQMTLMTIGPYHEPAGAWSPSILY